MDAQTFLDNFGVIAEAPGGVGELRDLILDLATSGALLDQDVTGTSAEVELQEIQEARERLIGLSGARRPKRPPPLSIPADELPEGWTWTQIDSLGIVGPRNQIDDATEAGFVPMECIPEGHGDGHAFQERLWGQIKKGYTHVADGDVAVAKITPCFENGKAAVFRSLPNAIGAATTELHVLRPVPGKVSPDYIRIFLRSGRFRRNGEPQMTGTAGQKRLPRDYFAGTAFPLPPLAEQYRIVAKVDELLQLCDTLQEHQQTRGHITVQARASTLDALIGAGTDDDLRTAWERLESKFGEMVDDVEGVAEMRGSILRLAVRGALAPQSEGDEPASVFLQQLAEERSRRVRTGELRGGVDAGGRIETSPYNLPKGWEWTTFGAACVNRDAERVPLKKSDRASRPGTYDYYGASGVIDTIDDFLFDGELLLIGEDGANLTLRSTPIAFMAKGKFWVNNHAHVLDSISTDALHYLCVFINSIDLRPHLTGIAQPKLNQKRLNSIPVPMPPLAEQGRIVVRVNKSMRLCDELERSMITRRKSAARVCAATAAWRADQ